MNLGRILASLLVLGVVGGSALAASQAFFSDTETSEGNVLAAGTFQIEVNDNESSGTFEIDIDTITGLMPGDTTGVGTITVKNIGNTDMATFGQFTLSDTGPLSLDNVLNFYNYKVEYFNVDGSPATRWATDDPYHGEDQNEDWFIRDGDTALWTGVGGPVLLNDWVFGNGPLDVPGTSWDIEALKPGEYYTLTFQFEMDPLAGNGYQGSDVTLGYVVKATQIDTDAIVELGLGGQLNDATYVGNSVVPYFQTQVAP